MKKRKGKRWKSGGTTPPKSITVIPVQECSPPTYEKKPPVQENVPYDKTGELPRRWVE